MQFDSTKYKCKFCNDYIKLLLSVYDFQKIKSLGYFYECKVCKIISQPKIIKNLYDDQNSSNYNLRKNFFFYLKQIILFFFIFKLKKFFNNKKDILDYGCGSGELAIALNYYFKKKNIFTADVFELEKKFIPKIKKHFLLHKNELKNQKFDIIILRHVFEHLFDLENFLEKIKINLKNQNSYLIIEVPNMDSIWRKAMGSRWPGYFYPYHYNVFSSFFLNNYLTKNGFHIVKEKKLEPPIFGTFLLTLNINNSLCKIISIIFYPFQFIISKLFFSSEAILIIAKKSD